MNGRPTRWRHNSKKTPAVVTSPSCKTFDTRMEAGAMNEWIRPLLSPLSTFVWVTLGFFLVWLLRNRIREVLYATGLKTLQFSGVTLGFDPESFAKETYAKQEMGRPSPKDIDEIKEIATLAQLLRPTIEGRRILWVDNYPGNNKRERRVLVSWGVEVQTRRTTEEAMTELRDQRERPFDLVISDWYRGGQREGRRLMERMLSNEERVDVPILFYFSATTPKEYRGIQAEAREHHAVGATSSPRQLLRWTLAELWRAPLCNDDNI